MLKRIIGDRAFYSRVFQVAIPIMIQSGITNFVSMLDNIMVGQIGTLSMSGVSIVNQLLFVFNLCVFGATSGAGIFTAQFIGSGDHDGVRHTFRFKLLAAVILSVLGIGVFCLWGDPLVGLYLTGEGTPEDAAQTLLYARQYLQAMLFGLLPFALSNAYSGTLRESGQTQVPMVAGICAVLVNLCLNYVLIFGHFGAPALGVQGAAIATVISRYVELAIVAGWTHLHSKAHPFIRGAYRSVYIPRNLLLRIFTNGLPLMINEALWSTGMAVINQSYSLRGLDVVAALNIHSTLWNLSSVAFLSLGNAVGIIMGQMLGANAPESEIRSTNSKLLFTSVASCLLFGGLMATFSGLFPQIYKTTDTVRDLATALLCVSAITMPFHAYVHACYFTLRSGGQAVITFLFDSCFMWVCGVPVAFLLSRFTALPIIPLFAICQSTDLIKCALGAYMLRKGKWIRNLTQH